MVSQKFHRKSSLLSILGYWAWQYNDNFKTENHIRTVPDPDKNGEVMGWKGHDDIAVIAGKFHHSPIPQDMPQWEVLLFPRILDENSNEKGDGILLLFKCHHSITDGLRLIKVRETRTGTCLLFPISFPSYFFSPICLLCDVQIQI